MSETSSLFLEGMAILDGYYRDLAKEIAVIVLEEQGREYSYTSIREMLEYDEDYCSIPHENHEDIIEYVYQWIDLAEINVTFRGSL